MNNINCTGNIVRDLELKTYGDKEVLNNCIAIKRDYKTDGEYVSDFVDITCFGHSAKYLANYAKKGTKIALSGRIQQDTWEDQDGGNRSKIKIVVNNVEILDSKQSSETKQADPFNNQTTFDVNSDNLPF